MLIIRHSSFWDKTLEDNFKWCIVWNLVTVYRFNGKWSSMLLRNIESPIAMGQNTLLLKVSSVKTVWLICHYAIIEDKLHAIRYIPYSLAQMRVLWEIFGTQKVFQAIQFQTTLKSTNNCSWLLGRSKSFKYHLSVEAGPSLYAHSLLIIQMYAQAFIGDKIFQNIHAKAHNT